MMIGSNGMMLAPGMSGEGHYAGAAPATPSTDQAAMQSEMTAAQQKAYMAQQNALMQQQHAQSQRRTNWIVGGTIVAILAIGGVMFWKSRS